MLTRATSTWAPSADARPGEPSGASEMGVSWTDLRLAASAAWAASAAARLAKRAAITRREIGQVRRQLQADCLEVLHGDVGHELLGRGEQARAASPGLRQRLDDQRARPRRDCEDPLLAVGFAVAHHPAEHQLLAAEAAPPIGDRLVEGGAPTGPDGRRTDPQDGARRVEDAAVRRAEDLVAVERVDLGHIAQVVIHARRVAGAALRSGLARPSAGQDERVVTLDSPVAGHERSQTGRLGTLGDLLAADLDKCVLAPGQDPAADDSQQHQLAYLTTREHRPGDGVVS